MEYSKVEIISELKEIEQKTIKQMIEHEGYPAQKGVEYHIPAISYAIEAIQNDRPQLDLNSLIKVKSDPFTSYQISSIAISNSIDHGEEVTIKAFKPKKKEG